VQFQATVLNATVFMVNVGSAPWTATMQFWGLFKRIETCSINIIIYLLSYIRWHRQ